jgi:hypothetical protein
VGRLAGGATLAEERAFVLEFMDGRVVKASDFASLAQARATAERLAAEPG